MLESVIRSHNCNRFVWKYLGQNFHHHHQFEGKQQLHVNLFLTDKGKLCIWFQLELTIIVFVAHQDDLGCRYDSSIRSQHARQYGCILLAQAIRMDMNVLAIVRFVFSIRCLWFNDRWPPSPCPLWVTIGSYDDICWVALLLVTGFVHLKYIETEIGESSRSQSVLCLALFIAIESS